MFSDSGLCIAVSEKKVQNIHLWQQTNTYTYNTPPPASPE